jgi:hypothetical protein
LAEGVAAGAAAAGDPLVEDSGEAAGVVGSLGAEVLGAEVLGAEVLGAEVLGAEVLGAEVLGAEISGPLTPVPPTFIGGSLSV